MKIKSSAISLAVADVHLSGKFLREHLGFAEKFSADGFAYLVHPDAGMDIVFLRIGLAVLPEHMHTQKAEGLIVAFGVKPSNEQYADNPGSQHWT